jgi:Fe-Mn family superoxide dismutase
MAITLPELPYNKGALAPHISEKTVEFHYGKHHNAYVDNTNKLIANTNLSDSELGTIIQRTANDSSMAAIFNNAAQVWNHTFYWHCMRPCGGGAPTGVIADKIRSTFGSYESFAEKFKNAGMSQFGSGWAWLILKDDVLDIMRTSNADTPLAYGFRPLLTVDVWEHAYYLDYQNRRADYLSAFLQNHVTWEFVNQQMV